MPGKVKVKILQGKNLPVMDRSSDTTDAYVEIKLGNTTYKTDVCRKSLNPQWNSEWYRFEVDDSELQDEPLQIRVMDHDTYSANDAIGKVYLNLNPLLLPAAGHLVKYGYNTESNLNHDNSKNSVMSGWIPVYDTMHGIRGEVNVIVKVELFSDFNKFRQSSCGVQFFCSPTVPHGYYAEVIHGFVEELIVNDDPEYQWIDKIRTPRASNEARQTLFFKLSGELQRKIGVKALNLGGNAVIGYNQLFDLEGESGIVARGIGTAVTLVKIVDQNQSSDIANNEENNTPPPSTSEQYQNSRQSPEPIPRMSHSPAKLNNTIACIYRRSSDSDLSITPKGNSLTGSDRSGGGVNCNLNRNNIVLRSTIHQDNFDMLEYPFLTMTKFPPGFIVQLGGAISARSVKLLERNTNMEEPESRNDIWWSEIRMEIRSHARSLNCNAVLGYTETTSICEDVCVLSASGTAAVISFKYTEEIEDNFANLNLTKSQMTTSLDRNNFDKDKCIPKYIESNNRTLYESPEHLCSNSNSYSNSNQHFTPCTLAHLPYDTNNVPVRVTIVKCGICMRGKVPDILIATIEPPENIPSNGRGCFVESIISRPLKDLKGESLAKDISDGLPFLEYELQRLLINKLKIKGMNSIFGLKIRISIGEKMLIGIATGTAMFLTLLPSPLLPKLVSDRNSDEKKLDDLKKLMRDTVKKNKEIYQLKTSGESYQNYFMFPEYDDSEDELNSIDLLMGNKDCCILEIDDPQDAEVINLLMEDNPPDGFHVVNTETVPGLQDLEIVKNLQLFTQIYRAKINASFNLHDYFRRLLQSLYFKLRRMVPCALCDLQFRVDLPEPDEIQLCVIGMALGLGKQQKKNVVAKRNDDDLIFKLDEDQVLDKSVSPNQSTRYLQTYSSRQKQRSPSKTRHSVKQGHIPYKERHGVDITPLSYVPGGKIERYLGNLNFFFIRETTSIREEGGLSGFIHSFITEVLAIVRAHITALGGNAMVAYFLTEWIVNYNLHKNQGQCLINVGGDVVVVSYFDEDE